MILIGVKLYHVGPFPKGLRIGPLKEGLNVLAAPNEFGKTTLLRAIAAGLFYRHNSHAQPIQSLRPIGTRLAPQITIAFRHGSTSYRIEKRFLHRPTSQLHRLEKSTWIPIAEGDVADRMVLELLGLPNLNATQAANPQSWGLLQFLWTRQDLDLDPNRLRLDPQTFQQLSASLPQVQLDTAVSTVLEATKRIYQELLSPTHLRPRARLATLQKEIDQLLETQQQLAQQRAALEQTQQAYQTANQQVQQLQSQLETLQRQTDQLTQQAQQVQLLLTRRNALEAEYRSAQTRLETVYQDKTQIQTLTQKLSQTRNELAQIQTQLQTLHPQIQQTEKELAQAQQHHADRRTTFANLQAQAQTLRTLKDYLTTQDALHHLTQRLQRIHQLQTELQKIRQQQQALPPLDASTLDRLRQLHQQQTTLQAKLEAAGLSLQLQPDHPTSIRLRTAHDTQQHDLQPDSPTTLRIAASAVELELPGWGKIRIQTGAREPTALEQELQSIRQQLAHSLAALHVSSLSEAEDLFQQLRRLQDRAATLQEQLQNELGPADSPQTLHTLQHQLEQQLAALREQIPSHLLDPLPASETVATQLAQLETQIQQLNTELAQSESRITQLHQQLETLRSQQTQLQHRQAQLEASVQQAEQTRQTLLSRYPEGIDRSLQQAQSAFVQADARLQELNRRLPPDAEAIPNRATLAQQQLRRLQTQLEQATQTRDRLRGQLEALGRSELHRQDAETAERLTVLQQEYTTLRHRALAAVLLCRLLEYRQRSAATSVKDHLTSLLTSFFQHITNDSDRQVFVDEELRLLGVGSSPETMVPFPLLSQGAQEQLLLALRLAVARTIARHEPYPIILDDGLVHTDPTRWQQIRSLLQTESQHYQILLFTCHLDRYQHLGHPIPIQLIKS